MAQLLRVNAQLMRATGFRQQRHPRHRQQRPAFGFAAEALNHAIARARRFTVNRANRHPREQRRIAGNRRINDPFIIDHMSAEQRAVALANRPLAELLTQCGIDAFITRNHHDPRRTEIEPMHQRAAGKLRHQSVMHRIQIKRIFSRQAQQPAGLADIRLPERRMDADNS